MKTTILLDFGSGASAVVGPMTVYVRAASAFVSGNKVILPGPGPVPLDAAGRASVELDAGQVWEFVVSAPSYMTVPEYRVVPESAEPVQYADLITVARPPETVAGMPAWVGEILLSVDKATSAQLSAAEAQAAVQRLYEDFQAEANPGQPGGVATLDSAGHLLSAQLPDNLRELDPSQFPDVAAIINERVTSVDLREYGIDTQDATTDQGAQFQDAMDGIATRGGYVRVAMPNINLGGRTVVLRAPGVHIDHGRIINGTLAVESPVATNMLDLEFDIDGTILEWNLPKEAGRAGLSLGGVRSGKVRGVEWNGDFDYGVLFQKRAQVQHVRRILFDSTCSLKGKGTAAFYAEQWSPSHFGLGDIQINGLQIADYANGVKLRGVDGLKLLSTTVFMAQNPARERAVDLEYITYADIVGNSLFEAGLEALLLARFDKTNVLANRAIWPGQLGVADGFRFAGGDTDGFSNSNSRVADNTVEWATRHGIVFEDAVDGIAFGGNTIIDLGKSAKFAGSAADKATIATFEHYAIVTPAGRTNYRKLGGNTVRNTPPITVDGVTTSGMDPNTGLGTRFDYKHTGQWTVEDVDGRGEVQTFDPSYTVNTNATSLDGTRGFARVQLAQPAATTITAMTPPIQSGKRVLLTAFNGNTTLKHDATASTSAIKLWDSKDVTVPNLGTIELLYSSGAWREIRRSWPHEQIQVLTQAAYDALTTAQKAAGVFGTTA